MRIKKIMNLSLKKFQKLKFKITKIIFLDKIIIFIRDYYTKKKRNISVLGFGSFKSSQQTFMFEFRKSDN